MREAVQAWFAVTVVLLAIFLANRFARVLGDAAAGELPREAVATLLGLASIYYLLVLIPIGLFLGIMLALGRLYRDSEMAAITAAGVGPARLYRPLLLVALMLSALLGWMSLFAGPWAAQQGELIKSQARQDAELGLLEPGRFRQLAGGTAVFYAESIAEDGTLENVFIQRRIGEVVEVAVAARGRQVTDAGSGLRTVILFDGQRLEGAPGTTDFRIASFAEHGIPVTLSDPELDAEDRETYTLAQLLDSDNPLDVAEFQWRLSFPLSVIVLTLLAVPLSRTDPRAGRYGKVAAGVLVYLFYANLLGAARLWVERGEVPAVIGLWWVHGLLVVIALTMLWWQGAHLTLGGWFRPSRRRAGA